MITYIHGPNTFIVQFYLKKIAEKYPQEAIVRVSGGELLPADLSELFRGQSLFTLERLVIIKGAADASATWQAMVEWLPQIPETTHVVIIASQPDKRTKAHKALLANSEVIEAGELHEPQATDWLIKWSAEAGMAMQPSDARFLVERIGTDQWQLSYAYEKLLLSNDTSKRQIEKVIDAAPQANAFAVLDAALNGKQKQLKPLLADLAGSEDPYKFFGLLAQQIFQLAVVSQAGGKTAEAIAKDIGAHPYPIKKLQSTVRDLPAARVKYIVAQLARLDDQLKRSSGDPWVLIEKMLYLIA